jgi:prepilin-type N-terminal cleavage/methylation domain-containing protein
MCNRSSPNHIWRPRGFTLVELLVVIGIIALLIAMLLPALQKARDQSNRTKCLSGQRQIVTAMLMYATENKQMLPFCNWLSMEDGAGDPYFGTPGWLYRYGATGNPFDAANQLEKTRESGALWPYLKTHELYRCPVELDTGFDPAKTSKVLASFLMNGALCAFGTDPGLRVSSFKGDAVLIWEVDERFGWWNDGSGFPTEGITMRHNKGGTIACIDGHAEWMSRKDWRKEAEQPNTNGFRSRVWCDPNDKGPHPRGTMQGTDQ